MHSEVQVHDFENKTNWFLNPSMVIRLPTKVFFNLFSAEVWWGTLLGKCLFEEKFFLAWLLTRRNINFEEFLKIFKLIRCTLLKWMHESTILHWRLRFYWDAALVFLSNVKFFPSLNIFLAIIKLSWSTKFEPV